MRELILGDIPEDFDPDKHQVLGPWSFFGSFEKQKYLVEHPEILPQLSFSREQHDEIDQTVAELFYYFLPILSQHLNQKNRVDYNPLFWKIMMGDWLNYLLNGIVEKRMRLQNFFAWYGNRHLKVDLLQFTNRGYFFHWKDFNVSGHICNIYNAYLASIALETLPNIQIKKTIVTMEYAPASRVNSKKPSPSKDIKYYTDAIKKFLGSINTRFFISQTSNGLGFVGIFFLGLLLHLKAKRYSHDGVLQKLQKAQKHPPEKILSWLDWESFLLKNLPVFYYTIKEIKPLWPVYKKGIFICQNYKDSDPHMKRFALMYSKNVRFLSAQNGGGGYGEFFANQRCMLAEY